MPLGSNYLGSAYLGEGYGSSTVQLSGTLSATVTISASATLTNIPATGNLLASVTEGFSPETIGGVPGNLSVTASTAMSGTIIVYGAGGLVASVTCAISSGSVAIYVPSHQPGYQYVRDIPSTALPNNGRQYLGVGVPSPSLGNNGDLYARADGVVGTDSLYKRSAGAWTAIN